MDLVSFFMNFFMLIFFRFFMGSGYVHFVFFMSLGLFGFVEKVLNFRFNMIDFTVNRK